MSVIDKVTVGGTTYDLQDTKAQNDCAELKSAIDAEISERVNSDNEIYDIIGQSSEASNNGTIETTSNRTFVFYFTNPAFLLDILPVFSANSGNGTIRIFEANNDIADNVTANLIVSKTFTVGDTISINRQIGSRTLVSIKGNANAILKYCGKNQTAGYSNAKIARITYSSGTYTIDQVAELDTAHFAGTFRLYTPYSFVNADISQDLTVQKKNQARENIDAPSNVDVSDINSVLGELFTEQKTLSNSGSSSATARVFGAYFKKPTYVKQITPVFSVSSGTATVSIYKILSPVADNAAIKLVESSTFSIGSAVTFNRIIGTDELIAFSSGDGVIKYRGKNTSYNIDVGIARVSTGGTKLEQVSELSTAHFAGTFVIYDIPTIQTILSGKTLMAIGDSMVYGHTLGTSHAWPALVADKTGMVAINKGTNGAYMANYQYNSKDNSVYQKLCVSTSQYYITDNELNNTDYIIIFAGTNDCNHSVTIGNTSSTNPLEFCGALNLICNTLQSRAPSKKIAFITPYLRAGIETRCRNYINAIKDVCEKYSIPVYDNGTNGGVCWSNAAMVSALTLNDTLHLNDDGMEYVSTKYISLLNSL